MKKYLIIMFLFFYGICLVDAKTYYGEYKYIGTEEIKLSDEVIVEKIKLYNTYKTIKKDLGYLVENKEYLIDYDDFIENNNYLVEYIEYVNEFVTIPLGNFQTCILRLDNFPIKTKINEIEIYQDDELLDFDLSSISISNLNNIFDGNYNNYGTTLSKSSFLEFNFKKNIVTHRLKIVIYTTDSINNNFIIKFGRNEMMVNLFNNNRHEYIFRNVDNIEYKYLNSNKLYRHYEEEKVPNDIYVVDGEDIILDDYKYINKYYKRNKLVLKDNNIIDDEYNKLEDFIEYSSGDVNISCDINYKVNGEYECLYVLDDIVVNKVISVVNNKEKKEEKETLKENMLYVNDIDYSNIDNISVDNEEEKIEEVVIENKKIDEVKKEENIVKKLNINKVEEVKNRSFNKYILIKYFIFIIFIGIELILFIKRKRKKVERV